jgi:hypothetical protein
MASDEPNIASPSFPAIPADVPIGMPRPAVRGFTLPPDPTVIAPTQGPVTAPAPPPVQIPDGDPADVAKLLASRLVPTQAAASDLVKQLDTDLAQAVEDCRLHPAHNYSQLVPFAVKIGGLLERKQRLTAKAAGSENDGPIDVASDATAVIRGVAKFSDGEILRSARHQQIAAMRNELAQAERLLQSTVNFFPTGRDPVATEQQLRAQLEQLLQGKQQAALRLAEIDGTGDSGRAAALAPAIKAAGGIDVIAKTLSKSMSPGAQQPAIAETENCISLLDLLLGGIDPATAKAANLRAERAQLVARAKTLRDSDGADRKSRATQLLTGASTGDLGLLSTLAAIADQVGPDFATAVKNARGTDDDLVAVVRSIISADKLRHARVAAMQAIHRQRMSGH